MIATRTTTTKLAIAQRMPVAMRSSRMHGARAAASGLTGSRPASCRGSRATDEQNERERNYEQDQAHRPERLVPRLARDGVAHVQGDLAGQRGHRLRSARSA